MDKVNLGVEAKSEWGYFLQFYILFVCGVFLQLSCACVETLYT